MSNISWIGGGSGGGGGTSQWTLSGTDIYNNNAGNVGIGTTTPATKLDVNGFLKTANYTENATTSRWQIGNSFFEMIDNDASGDGGVFRISTGGVQANADFEFTRNSTTDTNRFAIGNGLFIQRNGGGTPSISSTLGLLIANTSGSTSHWVTVSGSAKSNVSGELYVEGESSQAYFGIRGTQYGKYLVIRNSYGWIMPLSFENAYRFDVFSDVDRGGSPHKAIGWRAESAVITSGANNNENVGISLSPVPNVRLYASTWTVDAAGTTITKTSTGSTRCDVGDSIWIGINTAYSYLSWSPAWTKHTVTAVTSTTVSFTPAYSGAVIGTNTVYAVLEDYLVTIRDVEGNPIMQTRKDLPTIFNKGVQIEEKTVSNGSHEYKITDVSHSAASTYNVGAFEYFIFNSWVGGTGQARAYLPLVAKSEGRAIRFKSDGTINNSSYVTLYPNSADTSATIDGAASLDFDRPYDGLMVLCHNGNWYVVQRKSK